MSENENIESSTSLAPEEPETSEIESGSGASFQVSRQMAEAIGAIVIAVVAFMAGSSVQHTKDVNQARAYADTIKDAIGGFQTAFPTDTPTESADTVISIGESCTYDDGFSLAVTKAVQDGRTVRVTVRAHNGGTKNIDLTMFEIYYNYGSSGLRAEMSSGYGMNNPFMGDGSLVAGRTMTRTAVFKGPGISLENGLAQLSGMSFGWPYAACSVSTP